MKRFIETRNYFKEKIINLYKFILDKPPEKRVPKTKNMLYNKVKK